MRTIVVICMAGLLAACAGKTPPLTVSGACGVFEAPPYVVKGRAAYDQRWIDTTIERGVAGCNWGRPLARPAALDRPRKAPKRIARASRAKGAAVPTPKPAPRKVRLRERLRNFFRRKKQ